MKKQSMSIDFWGAEANLTRINWFGYKAIKKVRTSKNYRVSVIDKKLRRKRTITEAKLLITAKKANVKTPFVFDIDLKETTIIMEFVEGIKVKDYLRKEKNSQKQKEQLMFHIGEKVGLLHKNDIIHGDLTTSNILLQEKNLVFIDFGLGKVSNEVEDKAVDVLLMKKCLMSTHAENHREYFFSFQKGYKATYDKANETLRRAQKVEARGRHLKEEDVILEYLL